MLSVRVAASAALSFVFLAPSLLAQEPKQEAKSVRPKFQFLRQNEDWSKFSADPNGSVLDRLKHIDLSDDGWAWLNVGGRADTRFESWDGFGFGARTPGNQDDFILTRVLLYADLHLGSKFRAFVEGKTAQSTERLLPGGRRGLDQDTIALHQAFVDYTVSSGGDDSLTVRVGRQSFLFGGQRLISPLPWGNTLRTWDGVAAILKSGHWVTQAFATQFVPVRQKARNKASEDLLLYGFYATRKPVDGGRGLDIYALGNTRPASTTVNGTIGEERRHTLGFRSWGPLSSLGEGFDAEVEAVYQFGEVGNNSVTAWSGTGVLGYKPKDVAGKPRFFAGIDAASGDSRAGGGVGTFHQLFPLGHAYFGWADIIARQNVLAFNVGISLQVEKSTNLKLVAHSFRLMERNDALYGVSGGPARGGLGSRDVAQEIDVLLTHVLQPGTKVYAGYSHVFNGGGIAASGPSDDINFFYVGAGWMF